MNKEFNFDELDKAVNSLIGDESNQTAQASQPAANNTTASQAPQQVTPVSPPQPPSTSPTVPPRGGATPVPSRNIPAAERTASPAAQPAPAPVASPAIPPAPTNPPAEKPGSPGRFMDVMHPASGIATPAREEMKKGAGAEGKTVAPLNDNITPDPLPENSAANTPNSAQLSTKEPVNPDAMITTPDTEEKKWKDPLDEVTKNEKEREITGGAKERLGLTPKSTPQETDDTPKDDKKPLFLPDAKVEKRPLGAFAESGSEDKSGQEPEEKESAKDTAPKLTIDGIDDIDDKNKGEESSEPLPPELGKEIVAVEAGGAIAEEEDQGQKKEEELSAKKDNKEKEDKKDKSAAAKPETFSIPKQYKEKPASKEQKPKSIYDTEEYHRSLATAAAKKKKGSKWWVWVLIVLGLLVVGVGLGAGAYFLVGI